MAGFVAMTSSIMGYEKDLSDIVTIPTTLPSEIQNIFKHMSTILASVLGTTADFTKIASVTLMATSATYMDTLSTAWNTYMGTIVKTTYRPAQRCMIVSSFLYSTSSQPTPKVSMDMIIMRNTST